MEKNSRLTMKDFGGRVASVWEGLRPTTRSLVERALLTPSSIAAPRIGVPYDARAEWELSRLLAALDDRVAEATAETLNAEKIQELRRMTETCASVLRHQAQSAELFAQLLERAMRARDYKGVDALADALSSRVAPSEICELTRHKNAGVRAIAREALAQSPTNVLLDLLNDPVDADAAREALARQADDYGSEEARWVTQALDRMDTAEEED